MPIPNEREYKKGYVREFGTCLMLKCEKQLNAVHMLTDTKRKHMNRKPSLSASDREFSSVPRLIALKWSKTPNYVKMLIVWSIHVNTAGYVSSERKQLGLNRMCISIMDPSVCS